MVEGYPSIIKAAHRSFKAESRGYSPASCSYSRISPGWHCSMEQMREIFSRDTIFPMRSAWIVLSESNFSRRSLVVLYPASFRAASISILYFIGIKLPLSCVEGLFLYSPSFPLYTLYVKNYTKTSVIINKYLHEYWCNMSMDKTRKIV